MSAGIRLWVDDDDWTGSRNPPSAAWTWAKSSTEALTYLETGEVTEISLDHDLGKTLDCRDCGAAPHDEDTECCRYCYHDDTSRVLVNWMCENDTFPEKIHVHTANQVGYEWLVGTINRYGPGVTPREAE